MSETAVIDRFEGDQAVLLVGESERQVVVTRSALPHGSREGHWLQVEFAGDQLVSAAVDEAGTARAKERIAEKLERLRRGEHRES
jgi:hypothetical protein